MRYQILLIVVLNSVASFAQNYQFLGSYSHDGTPNYLVEPADVVSDDTQQMIKSSLPEGFPVPDYNPHYISSGYDTDIVLKHEADIWITFVSEGAGYRNVLGFYTYEINNPSKNIPDQEDITIIFPNVSAQGSGGGLQMGDKVNIGKFPAGTAIGWVLLANGWNGRSVTSGQWQLYSNPAYNPEADTSLKHHNVLLKDPDNERIILGFEDIRRDYNSCDNDFNDAVFYITANPYSAINTDNLNDVNTASDVMSANSGGLESNGNLAGLIAQRNFLRNTTQSAKTLKNKQVQLNQYITQGLKSSSSSNLQSYIPQTGMYGTEQAFVSTPADLLNITNAVDIFSVDYYNQESRIAAVLATYTKTKVYDHSKAICDRLNSSSLEDVRTVTVRGHQLISSKIRRANGNLENSLSFSIQMNSANYNLYSYWNIDQYPDGDYYNFQIWGSSFSQVFSLAIQIIDRFNEEKNTVSEIEINKVPAVIVKSGYYKSGKIHLQLLNKSAVNQLNINGNMASTEVSDREDFFQTITLSGNRHDSVTIETGQLFDIGLSINAANDRLFDALYLADGPWGIDYLEEKAMVESFYLENENTTLISNDFEHRVERDPGIVGEIKGTLNLFRQLLPGDQTLNVDAYQAVHFSLSNTHPIEVILMEEGLTNWENRFSYLIPVNTSKTEYSIALSDFENKNGEKFSHSELTRIVFSINGNGQTFEPYQTNISKVFFGKPPQATSIKNQLNNNKIITYPNPFSDIININIDNPSAFITVKLVDVSGRVLHTQKIFSQSSQEHFVYDSPDIPKGIYFLRLSNDQNEVLSTQSVIKR